MTRSNLWFFKNGTIYPEPSPSQPTQDLISKLFPPNQSGSDRFVNQMMFIPSNYEVIRNSNVTKKILFYNRPNWVNVVEGGESFKKAKCPVDKCELSFNRSSVDSADLVLIHDNFWSMNKIRTNQKQIYALFQLESPFHGSFDLPGSINSKNIPLVSCNLGIFNWTVTYRRVRIEK